MRLLLFSLFGVFFMAPSSWGIDPEAVQFDKLPSRAELPDPLVMFDGTPVTTKEAWQTKRKPELKELFQDLMYGRYPTAKVTVTGKVVHEDKQAFGGKATLREIAVTVSESAPPFYLLVVTPNKRSGATPVFVGLNFGGNHLLTLDEKVHLPEGWMPDRYPGVVANKATAEGRGKQMETWPLETIVDRGYAVATVYSGDIIPDNPKIRGGLADVAMPIPDGKHSANATATVMAWAWGIHRAIDYLTTMPEIDAKRIAAVGHSRLGKTVLVAAAFDERIAVAIPSQAGCGGTAPNRRTNPKSEPVPRINTAFPHWFSTSFKQFNDATDKLPFDQHCLVALCAPRPVLFTNATDDVWADPPGQFEMLKAASPVYKLLGVEGLTTDRFPDENKLVDSRLGYWIRPGKHAMGPPDWETYLMYADKWLK